MSGRVVGRELELAAVVSFLEPVERGFAALLMEGGAGIGKTTVWRFAVDAAREREFRVLVSRPLEMEMQLPFAGLRDLLQDVLDELLHSLPEPQRVALETALLLAAPDGPPPDPAAIAFALHSGLKTLAKRASVVVAVDDAQWLDQPSANALSFAARRLGDAR